MILVSNSSNQNFDEALRDLLEIIFNKHLLITKPVPIDHLRLQVPRLFYFVERILFYCFCTLPQLQVVNPRWILHRQWVFHLVFARWHCFQSLWSDPITQKVITTLKMYFHQILMRFFFHPRNTPNKWQYRPSEGSIKLQACQTILKIAANLSVNCSKFAG